jgi:hypothetical protein
MEAQLLLYHFRCVGAAPLHWHGALAKAQRRAVQQQNGEQRLPVRLTSAEAPGWAS